MVSIHPGSLHSFGSDPDGPATQLLPQLLAGAVEFTNGVASSHFSVDVACCNGGHLGRVETSPEKPPNVGETVLHMILCDEPLLKKQPH